MSGEEIRQWITTLGFPVCTAIALGWAMFKIMMRLLDGHFTTLAKVEKNLEEQTKTLVNIQTEIELLSRQIRQSSSGPHHQLPAQQ
jgi:hypothetical protein